MQVTVFLTDDGLIRLPSRHIKVDFRSAQDCAWHEMRTLACAMQIKAETCHCSCICCPLLPAVVMSSLLAGRGTFLQSVDPRASELCCHGLSPATRQQLMHGASTAKSDFDTEHVHLYALPVSCGPREASSSITPGSTASINVKGGVIASNSMSMQHSMSLPRNPFLGMEHALLLFTCLLWSTLSSIPSEYHAALLQEVCSTYVLPILNLTPLLPRLRRAPHITASRIRISLAHLAEHLHFAELHLQELQMH